MSTEVVYNLMERCADLTSKIQHLIDYMDSDGQLDEHCFTFPDGDIWTATEQ